MRVLINLSSKVNAIYLAYSTKFGFCARIVNISAQKINEFYLNIFKIVITDYSVKNKLERV